MPPFIITSPYCLLINGPIPRKDNHHRKYYSVGKKTTIMRDFVSHTHTHTHKTRLLFDSDTFLFVHVGQHEGYVGSEQIVHFVAQRGLAEEF